MIHELATVDHEALGAARGVSDSEACSEFASLFASHLAVVLRCDIVISVLRHERRCGG